MMPWARLMTRPMLTSEPPHKQEPGALAVGASGPQGDDEQDRAHHECTREQP